MNKADFNFVVGLTVGFLTGFGFWFDYYRKNTRDIVEKKFWEEWHRYMKDTPIGDK